MPGNPWWPGSDVYPDDDSKWLPHPAFEVRRVDLGTFTGGDWVRGSTGTGNIRQAALRFPRTTEALDLVAAKGMLLGRPYQKLPWAYNTVELRWGVPSDLVDSWSEMVVVRSAFGCPSTVNDGQVAIRMKKTDIFPNSPFPDATKTRYTFTYLDPRDPGASGAMAPKDGLPSGRWYYYTLFFKVGTLWRRSMTRPVLLPRNFDHHAHLWDSLPPVYRQFDSQFSPGGDESGHLSNYLSVPGFELDYIREFVEQWQELYHIDFSPLPLLKRLGQNFNVEFEQGLGDIRYRALLAHIGNLYNSRGTIGGLRQLIRTVSKCEVEIDGGKNIMLTPDDSEFIDGTGLWSGLHPNTTTMSIVGNNTPIVADENVRLENSLSPYPPQDGYGRGVMKMWTPKADATTNVIIACGDGFLQDWKVVGAPSQGVDVFIGAKEVVPLSSGIPVSAGNIYSFSMQVLSPSAVIVQAILAWFDKDGYPSDVLSVIGPQIGGITPDTWTQRYAQGTAPTNVRYLVPMISFTNRLTGSDALISPIVYFCGGMVSLIGSSKQYTAGAPDNYMLMGDPNRPIGEPGVAAPATFVATLIGEPPGGST